MSDAANDGGTVPEPTLKAEALAARLADLVVAVGLASHAAASVHAASARATAALGAYFALAGAPEPSADDIKRAQARLVASLGGSPERNGAAPPKPRIVTDG